MIPTDIWFQLFVFLHLDEWLHVLYLNKAHFYALKLKMLKFVTQMGKLRLENLIESETQMNNSEFWSRIRSVNGQVSGSIHLQVLLGKEKFKSNDMDIFIMENDVDKNTRKNHIQLYSVLHQFLFEYSTGLVSDNKFLTPKQRTLADKNVKMPNFDINDLEIIQKRYNPTYIIENVENIYQIKNIYTYTMKKRVRSKVPRLNIQVIALKNRQDHTETHSTFVENFIQNRFDFTISTSMYNGLRYKTCNLLDIYNRRLQLFDDYKLRISFFNESQERNHRKRVKKYMKRKFKLCDKFIYGDNLKLLRKDERNEEYFSKHVKINLQDFVQSHLNKRQKLG